MFGIESLASLVIYRIGQGRIKPIDNKNNIKMLSECLTLVGKPGNR